MLAARREGNNNQWAFGSLSKLGSLARIMGYLVRHSPSTIYAV